MLVRLTMAALALTGAAISSLSAAEKAAVNVYMYSEYIDPAVPKEFEAATGYPLVISTYESQEEMLAKLRAGSVNQYDVVVATDVIVTQLIKLKLVQPFDQTKLPNAKNIDPQFRKLSYDPKDEYTVPYQWGTIGLLYDTTKVPAGKPTWKWLFDPAQQVSPFVMMDEMRSMLGIALKFDGASMNSRDAKQVKAAADLLIAAKKSAKCLGFDGGVGGKDKVLKGEATAAVVYNGDAVRALGEKPTLAYAVPAEGSNIWCDNLLITSQAPNLAGAHAFVNYVLDAKVAAQISNFNRYATPVSAAFPLITPADKANPAIYPDAATMKSLEYLEDLGKDTRLTTEAWTAVKSQ